MKPLIFKIIYQLQGVLSAEPSALELLQNERRREREREDRRRGRRLKILRLPRHIA